MTPQTITITALSHIEASLNKPLSLEAVAKRVGYSPFHLHRVFSQTVGIPMHVYIRRRRLTEAAKQIALSDDPIIEIAFAAGYESQQSFTMAFKAMYKRPPSQFRRLGRFYPLQLPFTFCSGSSGGKRWSWNLDHIAADLRWIQVSHQAAIFLLVSVVSYASFGVNMPWLE